MKVNFRQLLFLFTLCAVSSCSTQEFEPIGPDNESKRKGDDGTSYTITIDSTITQFQQYFDRISHLSELTPENRSLVMTMVSLNLTLSYQAAHIYCYDYQSLDPKGNPVTLSSALILPEQAVTNGTPIDRIILGNHFSMIGADECPTRTSVIEGLLAWSNSAVVLPDYYGFGASEQYCQAYLDPDCTARGNIDALNAAYRLLADKKVSTTGKPVINLGYSQGGFNAMANLKYLSEHTGTGVEFANTLAGGGPYNVINTFKGLLEGGYAQVFPLVALTVVSFNECQQLGIDYAQLFKGSLYDNWNEWFVKGKDSTQAMDRQIDGNHPEDYLTAQLISMQGRPYEQLDSIASRFSLNRGWTPVPGTKLTLYHAEQDDMVPYSNYTDMKDFLDQYSSNCDFTFVSSTTAGSHVLGYVEFFITRVFPALK